MPNKNIQLYQIEIEISPRLNLAAHWNELIKNVLHKFIDC